MGITLSMNSKPWGILGDWLAARLTDNNSDHLTVLFVLSISGARKTINTSHGKTFLIFSWHLLQT